MSAVVLKLLTGAVITINWNVWTTAMRREHPASGSYSAYKIESCPAQRSAEIIWQHTAASQREHRERRQLTYRFYIIPHVKQDLPATTQRDCGSPSLLLKPELCSYHDLVKISPVQILSLPQYARVRQRLSGGRLGRKIFLQFNGLTELFVFVSE